MPVYNSLVSRSDAAGVIPDVGLYDRARDALHALITEPALEPSPRVDRMGNTSLYLATRHFYGWYALNVLGFPPHVIALHLGHDDGGELVRNLDGHPDAAIARTMTRDGFAGVGRTITPITRVGTRVGTNAHG